MPAADSPNPRGSSPKLPIADTLEKNQAKIPRPLLGIAVWNQLPVADGVSDDPPPALCRLLKTVLDLSVASARQLQGAQPADRLFPPYPDQSILDTRYHAQHIGGGIKATFEICVPGVFDKVKNKVDPTRWSAANFFWSNIQAPDAASVVKYPHREWEIKAFLNLPSQSREAVQLKARFSYTPFETRIKFQLSANKLLAACQGEITWKKEVGHPNAVRLINDKLVQFAPGPLHNYADATLKYWLQAESVALALQTFRGGHQ